MKEIALIIQSLLSTYIISCERILQVWIHLFPLIYCRNDAQLNDLVTHLAEVLVRLVQGSNLLSSTCRLCEVNASLVDSSRHCHHYVLEAELIMIYIATCRQCELLTTHSSLDHLDSIVGRTLE